MTANSQSFSRWSRLGLGTGRLASVGRGTTLTDVRLLLGAMMDTGVTIIDTADSYTSGRCEQLIGRAIRGRRDDFVIVTKAGYRYGDLPPPFRTINPLIKKLWQLAGRSQCHRASYLAQCLERSLRRLGTDHVDAYLLHDPPFAAVTDPQVHEAFDRLRGQGKFLHAGISSDRPEVITAAINA